MIIALCITAYSAVTLLCVYFDARITGDGDSAPSWIIWPILLPTLLVAAALHAIAMLGKRHHDV